MPQFDIKEKTNLVFSLDTKYEAVEGTDNYNELINKPSINDVTLIGNLTSSDLKIPTLDSFERIDNQVTDLTSTVSNHSSSIAKNTSDIQANAENISTNTTNINANTNAIQKNTNDIATNTQAIQTNADNISANTSSINNLSSTKADKSYVDTQLSAEVTNRESADTNLQSQIDALVSKSDVVDIVGTYADLQNYDTSTLGNNDIIKVLSDSTHDNAMSYYRWNKTTSQWVYIGSEGAYYTKSESDSRFVPSTRTINNKALSANITLEASDVGAQEVLVSGTNIKTINSQSLLGQGNIEVTDFFVAKYGTTTLVQLKDAIESHKQIYVTRYGVDYYVAYSVISAGRIRLACVGGVGNNLTMLMYEVTSGGVWTASDYVYPSDSSFKTINNQSLLGSTNIELPTKAYVNNAVATKQDTLVSGSNIKTINSESLLGSGNIVLPTTTEIETLIDSKLKAITNDEIDEIMGV